VLDVELLQAHSRSVESLYKAPNTLKKSRLDPFECPYFADSRKELTMSLRFFIDDPCPICRKPVKFAEIELHPSRPDLAIYNYHCIDCGPVTGKTYSLKPGEADQAA
jgi:hypothetical protein